MPFTISHAAVVLPFSRPLARWHLLSATIIGAMVPDFAQIFPWHVQRFETHSAIALFSFCLPVGLASYWIFQRLIKTPLLEVLPDGPYARSRPFATVAEFSSLRQWLLAACGLLGGALTHLVWDAFTHEGARGVRLIPMIDDPFLDIGSHHLVGVRLMQDAMSLIGLVIVLMYLCYVLRRGHESPVPSRVLAPRERQAWMVAYVASAILFTAGWYAWRLEPTGHSLNGVVIHVAIAVLRGVADALVGVSLVLQMSLRSRMRAA